MLLIDASMAMRNKTGMEREHELTTAKRVVEQLVTYLPTRLSMGLRVFGLHHVGELEDGGVETSCTDTQLIVPIGKLNRAAIIRNVGILSPGGVAPLNYSLHKAIEEDLGALDTPSFLVAIVDGDEACSGDVKAYAEKLATAKHAAPIHVFVLVLNPARAPDDGLKLLAQNTRGRYYEGSEGANQMIAQLRNVFQAEFKPHARSPFWCPLCGQQSWQSRQ